MLKDELNSLSKKKEVTSVSPAEEKKKIFADALATLKERAIENNDAVVLTIADYQTDLIDLTGCGYSNLDDTHEVVEVAKRRIKNLSIQNLRGVAAELRDHLSSEGLNLTLKHRVDVGKGLSRCNSSFNAWDLIAHW